MANSLPGSPIVGFYNEETQDFMGHEEEMIITDKAIEFKPLTTPYGFVDINAKVWFQWFLDDNQYEREYLVTEGYIWTGRYPEAKRVISQGNNQSMELDKNSTTGVWTKDSNNKPQFFIINEANISALCLLGEDVEPCFEGAQVASQFTLSEDFKNTFTLMAKELKEILSEGGNTMNEEYRMFDSMKEAYKRLDEITSLTKFVRLQISMYGENVTAKEILRKLNDEKCGIMNNLLEFLKNK
jgi:hypothetical protein